MAIHQYGGSVADFCNTLDPHQPTSTQSNLLSVPWILYPCFSKTRVLPCKSLIRNWHPIPKFQSLRLALCFLPPALTSISPLSVCHLPLNSVHLFDPLNVLISLLRSLTVNYSWDPLFFVKERPNTGGLQFLESII